MSVNIVPLTGPALDEAIPQLALLRIRVFREWPYLYDGDMAYEETYLKRFRNAPRAFLAAAMVDGKVVGAATAAPLSGEAVEFRKPFEQAGKDTSEIFYFAESLLLPEYRGKGIGHRFFDAREAHARSFGSYTHAAFCGVVRPMDHPLRPENYAPLDAFWRKRGYDKLEGIVGHFAWKDIGDREETNKPMQFWMREL